MRAVTLLFLMSSVCLGSGISGVWAFKRGSAAPASIPVAITIEQSAGQLRILKLMAYYDGNHVEQLLLNDAKTRTTRAGTEIQLPNEIWTIAASGKLTIRHNDQRLVLQAVRGVMQ